MAGRCGTLSAGPIAASVGRPRKIRAAERRTARRTGVLLYLSLAERRAEIVADAAIHAKVAPEVWGDAMAELLAHVREGRASEGMAAAVTRSTIRASGRPTDRPSRRAVPAGGEC